MQTPINDYELCNSAYHFRRTESMRHLRSKCMSTSRPELWSLVRHYIGRLGSWFKASKKLVEYCQQSPFLLKGFHVERVPDVQAIEAPRAGCVTELQPLLKRMLPTYDSAHIEQTLQDSRVSSAASIAEQYVSRITSSTFQPRMHAEIVVLEHFHINGLSFIFDDKYIGCSKASCYCCGLYFKNHPGGFVPRPCHQNVWHNWSIPPSAMDNAKSLRLSTIIIQNMVESMTKDLSTYIIAGPQFRSRPPDSTTGISSSAPHSRK